jgi:hypothetical protein
MVFSPTMVSNKKRNLCSTAIAEPVPVDFIDTNQRFTSYAKGNPAILRTTMVPLQIVTHHRRARPEKALK